MSGPAQHQPLDWWSAHVWVDLVAGGVVASAYWIWRLADGEAIVVLDGDGRATLYTALAGIAAALLAFGITPVAIVLALTPGPRLSALLKYHGEAVRRTLMAALWSLVSFLVVSVAALAGDTGARDVAWLRYLLLAVAVQALLSILRLLQTFSLLLRDINIDRRSESPALKRVDSDVA